MKRLLCFLLSFFIFRVISCQSEITSKEHRVPVRPGYNFSSPQKIHVLPAILHEISGISAVSSSTLACVQDENGVVFFYNIMTDKISRQIYFSYDGDYEGITSVNSTLYVLRSDGVVFELADFESEKFRKATYVTGVPGGDNEGLCYDNLNNRLLLGPKMPYSKKGGEKDKRYIYGFDPGSKKLLPGPVFTIDVDEIKKFARENNLKVPVKKKKGDKKEPDIEFRISAMGIHPLTGKLYVISGMEQLLFVFDTKGRVEFIEWLDPDIFPQPEGITFLKNGDMFISNEGQNKSATLVRFRYNSSDF